LIPFSENRLRPIYQRKVEVKSGQLDNVREESACLYDSLQKAVDQQIQKTGFVPPDGDGMEGDKNGAWTCSQKQRGTQEID
jgi:hypothetical protein